MKTEILTQYRTKIENDYRKKTKLSKAAFKEAQLYVAGGVTRETCYWKPYPVFVERGEGCRIYDLDGNEYVDYNNAFTSSLLGHTPPQVVEAIRESATKLLGAGAATQSIHQFAKLFCDRYSSVDKMRFCCSGTEAVMYACRAARAHTGKEKIVKHIGSYHGGTPEQEVAVIASTRGLTSNSGIDVIATNVYDRQAMKALFEKHQTELAGLLLNGVWFLKGDDTLMFLRDLCTRYGVPMIMDEVMSFRLAMGGAQEYFGVEADISCFGKYIGGAGLAVGAFGGREEIMTGFDYTTQSEPIHQAGTFAANPVTVAAGIASLKTLTPKYFTRLNNLGNRLKAGFNKAFNEIGIKGYVMGEGSLSLMGFGELEMVSDPRRANVPEGQAEVARLLQLAMTVKGNYVAGSGTLWTTTGPMTDADIDKTVSDLHKCLAEAKPVIAEAAHNLIGE
ncbi:MAG: aminotransferase class III-fold pyridoxal phosphate-dependent enzyme [Desulfobacula sp.]|uniref:aspartate aminotransferase family protein n=1 Tax=Desulfobacula sp. TaxID=2593537 RepID=UPI0025BE0A8E|nr:aminotransferase class III-fold pyridoxal phosphate-dependent enzyme [Desulfobacula sp.]MCD4719184.1 aminotransferase class III-fold pyridoxal phosphate-dependent enzyme [Desulfobacula sp.]